MSSLVSGREEALKIHPVDNLRYLLYFTQGPTLLLNIQLEDFRFPSKSDDIREWKADCEMNFFTAMFWDSTQVYHFVRLLDIQYTFWHTARKE